ncbi:unnamed protein product, partial [Nesidiocoris tenuis]
AGVVGAGCWAEGPVAVTVSGNGEDLIRTSLCKEVARAIMASNDLASTLVQTITKLFLGWRIIIYCLRYRMPRFLILCYNHAYSPRSFQVTPFCIFQNRNTSRPARPNFVES